MQFWVHCLTASEQSSSPSSCAAVGAALKSPDALPQLSHLSFYLPSAQCCVNAGLITVVILLLQLVYTEVLMENSPPSMFVLKVAASDPDVGANGQISYTLHGPSANKFHLNPRTGTKVFELRSEPTGARNISFVLSYFPCFQRPLTDIHHTLFLS